MRLNRVAGSSVAITKARFFHNINHQRKSIPAAADCLILYYCSNFCYSFIHSFIHQPSCVHACVGMRSLSIIITTSRSTSFFWTNTMVMMMTMSFLWSTRRAQGFRPSSVWTIHQSIAATTTTTTSVVTTTTSTTIVPSATKGPLQQPPPPTTPFTRLYSSTSPAEAPLERQESQQSPSQSSQQQQPAINPDTVPLYRSEGLLAVEKPLHWTSQDVVSKIRAVLERHVRQRGGRTARPGSRKNKRRVVKVGHGGTLDPLATGVLVIGVGKGTKELQRYVS